MLKRIRMMSLAALTGILILGASPGTVAAWDCRLDIGFVDRPAQARGLAFLGSLEEVQREKVTIDEGTGWVITFVFDVERVYEGPEAQTIRLPSLPPSCHGLDDLQLGERYLVSTAGDLSGPPGAPGSRDTLAWRVLPNEQVELLGFEIPAAGYSDEIRGPETVSQALRLLGLDDGLPPTDAAGGGSQQGAGMLSLVAATVMALASAAFLARPVARRSRRHAGAEAA